MLELASWFCLGPGDPGRLEYSSGMLVRGVCGLGRERDLLPTILAQMCLRLLG